MILMNQYAEYLKDTLLITEEDYKVWEEFLANKYGIKPTVEID